MTYKKGRSTSAGLTKVAYNIPNHWHNCKCCGRGLGLPSGSRGLCDGCEEGIPDYIPEEQYVKYMKEYWGKK